MLLLVIDIEELPSGLLMKRVVLSQELLLLVPKKVKSMTKKEARDITVKRFTNLIDGTVVSNVSVLAIISYYERLLYGQKTDPPKPYSNIVDSFIQEDINSMEEDDYPGL
jgi:hypothetical protein